MSRPPRYSCIINASAAHQTRDDDRHVSAHRRPGHAPSQKSNYQPAFARFSMPPLRRSAVYFPGGHDIRVLRSPLSHLPRTSAAACEKDTRGSSAFRRHPNPKRACAQTRESAMRTLNVLLVSLGLAQAQIANPGADCWDGCNQQQGACTSNYCGPGGACCRQGWAGSPIACAQSLSLGLRVRADVRHAA